MQGVTATLGCDASNVTGLVDKLVAQGFLERSESPHDRRTKIVKLTSKGVQTRSDALQKFAQTTIFSELTTEEIDTLARILSKLQPRQ